MSRSVTIVSLPGLVDITAVTAIAGELVHALDAGELALDARQVTRIDAAGMQLLYAAVVAARDRGHRVHWVGASRAVNEAAATLALAAVLELPAAALEVC